VLHARAAARKPEETEETGQIWNRLLGETGSESRRETGLLDGSGVNGCVLQTQYPNIGPKTKQTSSSRDGQSANRSDGDDVDRAHRAISVS